MDEAHLPELTKRQEEILSQIVRAYSRVPEPVSSKHLADSTDQGVRSATIRNEMAALEELGYIAKPHTSAGRVPTENGYRYFVQHLVQRSDLSMVEQSRISEKMQGSLMGTEQGLRHVAAMLARTMNAAALVTPPIAETSKFKHIELISIQGRLVLMVLVLQGGAVHQQMLTLTDPVAQPHLTEVAARLNALCANLNADELRLKSVQFQLLEREVADLAAELMEYADSNQARLIYRDGLGEIFKSFQNSEGAQQAVRVLEERAFLNMVLGEILTPMTNDVQVFIGGEGRWEEMKHLSIILSRYGIPGQASGAVGVLGPTHINYGKAISTVRYVSALMTDSLVSLYAASEPEKKDL
jgi:heat-inducible transcriptional repressor